MDCSIIILRTAPKRSSYVIVVLKTAVGQHVMRIEKKTNQQNKTLITANVNDKSRQVNVVDLFGK